MAYVVNNSRGQIVAVVEDGTINTSATSITLVGKSYTPYGEPIAENFVYMLENFANFTAPDTPIVGQLWWDMANNALNAYTGNTWAPVSGITVDDTPPIVDVGVGDMWFDTTIQRFKTYTDLGGGNYAWIGINAIAAQSTAPLSGEEGELYFNTDSQQLFAWSNGAWLLIGPENVRGFGETKWTSTTLLDTFSVERPVIQGIVDDEIIAIMAEDDFTINPVNRPVGFENITRGINMSDSAGVKGYFMGDVIGNVTGTSDNVTGVVGSANGGTGFSSYAQGQILVGNAAGMLTRANVVGDGIITVTSGVNDNLIISYTAGTGYGNVTSVGLTAGPGIGIVGGPITTAGNIQVTNTGVTSVVGGTGVAVNQATGNVVLSTNIVGGGPISITPGAGNSLVVSYTGGTGVGNVTSVGIAAGTGISVSGGPITTNGNITVNNTGVTAITAGTGIAVNQANGAVTVSSTFQIPTGIIVMWSGADNAIPSGWALCNGTNGTPDLRNRFIIASGGSFATNSTGGSFNLQNLNTQTAGAHDHSGATATHALTISEMPNHNHSIPNAVGATQAERGTTNHQAFNQAQLVTATGFTGGGLGHSHNIFIDGTHSHAVTGSYTPPYYSLAYIMKL